MNAEIRPIRAEELDAFKHVAANALVMSPDSFVGMQPEFTLCAFEDGRLATSYAAWPFTMRFNGKAVPVAAVTTVGTFPTYRRRGYLRRITSLHFQKLHEEGERPISVLLASLAAIYQRYGYAVVSTNVAYSFEPRYLRFAVPGGIAGVFREVGDDDFPVLVNLYRRFREDRTGYMHRGRELWHADVLGRPPGNGFLHRVVYEENGEPLGYVVYTIEPGTGSVPNNIIRIREVCWLTSSAYRAAWEYFANMDTVKTVYWGRVPPDDPLPHLLLEPRMLNATCSDGLLGRMVDVERALASRGYDEEGVLTLEVTDDLCPWNQGRWRLEASPEGSSVRTCDETPQVVMPVSTLAMVLFGQVSATEAARMGRLEVNRPDALPVWDRVMHTRHRPARADYF